jgi:hypothetical protein
MFGLASEDAEPIAVSGSGTPRAEVVVKVPKWADGTLVAGQTKAP